MELLIPNNIDPQRINKAGKRIAREEAGVILEWMIWENFSDL